MKLKIDDEKLITICKAHLMAANGHSKVAIMRLITNLIDCLRKENLNLTEEKRNQMRKDLFGQQE